METQGRDDSDRGLRLVELSMKASDEAVANTLVAAGRVMTADFDTDDHEISERVDKALNELCCTDGLDIDEGDAVAAVAGSKADNGAAEKADDILRAAGGRGDETDQSTLLEEVLGQSPGGDERPPSDETTARAFGLAAYVTALDSEDRSDWWDRSEAHVRRVRKQAVDFYPSRREGGATQSRPGRD